MSRLTLWPERTPDLILQLLKIALFSAICLFAVISVERWQRLAAQVEQDSSRQHAVELSLHYYQLREQIGSLAWIRSEYLSAVQLNQLKSRLEQLNTSLFELSLIYQPLQPYGSELLQQFSEIEQSVAQKNDLQALRSRLELSLQTQQPMSETERLLHSYLSQALNTENILAVGEISRQVFQLFRDSEVTGSAQRLAFGETGILSVVESYIITQQALTRQLHQLTQSLEVLSDALTAVDQQVVGGFWGSSPTLSLMVLVFVAVVIWIYTTYWQIRKVERISSIRRLDSLSFLSGEVAHDISNMISVVTGSLEVLREHTRESSRPLDRALYAAEKSIQMIDRLLIFSRRKHLKPEVTSVNELLSGLTEIVSLTCGEEVEVRLSLPKEELLLKVDPTQLENSIINLCLNSRNALARGGFIELSAYRTRTKRDIAIAVQDNGYGIPVSIQSKVLEPFYSFSHQGMVKGQGLGLSMVYGFVKQSNGELHIESKVNQGTRVEMIFNAS